MSEILARAFRWGLVGLVFGPAATYTLMLGILYFDPACREGVTEACNLDPLLNIALSTVVGFATFFLISMVNGLAKRARDALD
jgi:hypothetical protein